MISQIRVVSGTIIEIGLNMLLRLSGSSDLPAYPGFIVMNIAQASLRGITSSSKGNVVKSGFSLNNLLAFMIWCIY